MGDVPKPPVPDIVIEILGGEWPEGSETAMRALAGVWQAAADDIDTIVDDANTALTDLLSHIEGESKKAMQTSTEEIIDGESGLSVLATDYRALADMCEGFAESLEETKWIINVAMVEAVASLGFMFLGPLGAGAALAKLAAKKVAIRIAIKAAIKKVAAEGAKTSLKAVAKKAPTVMAKEVAQQAVTEAAVDQLGRRISAMDGSTSTSFSESAGALRDGAVYGLGSSAARRGLGRGSTTTGRVARNAAEGMAGTTAVSASHGEAPDVKDLTIGAAEGVMGGNHHGAGNPGSDTGAASNPGAGPNINSDSPTTAGPPGDAGGTSTTPSSGDPGGPGPGQSVTPGDPGGAPPGPVAGESVSPVGDGTATTPAGDDGSAIGDAGAGGHGDGTTHAEGGAQSDGGAQADGGAHADGAGQGSGDGGSQSDGGSQADGAGQGSGDAASGGDAGSNSSGQGDGAASDSSSSGGESATNSNDGAAAGDSAASVGDTSSSAGDSSTAGSDSSTSSGSEGSSSQSSDALPNGDNLSGLDLGGTGSDSVANSNITDAAGLSSDSASGSGPGTGDTATSTAGGGTSGTASSSDAGSASGNHAATGGEQSGQDHGGVAAAPPVSAMSAASGGAGGSAGGSSSSSSAKGTDTTGDRGTSGDTGTADPGSADGADPTPGGESVTPDSGDANDSGNATADTAETTPGETADDSDIVAAADSGTDASQSPEGLPAVDQHSDTAAPADKVGDTGDSDAPASEETVVPDSDHLSGLDLPDGDGTTPVTTTDPTTSVDSTPTDTSDADPDPADDPSSTPEDPSTPTNPDDVDTTDCGHNSLDALSERHPDLPSDRSGIGERGDGPVPAGALYDAAGITPDLHPRQGTDQAGHPDDSATDAFDAISDRLTELGDGSTALVTSNWTAGTHTGGHTYLAHNDGGDITFTDPTSGESHPWPPTYSDVGDVAAGYVNSDGTPAHGNSTAGDVSSAIGEVDANKKPATYTDWETADRSDLHPDFDAPRHAHPDGAISEQEVRTRTATLPTGETVTIEERRTVYAPGHPPGQDPPPRDGERVTVTTTSVSAGDSPDVRNTVTWTEHGSRTIEAELNLRHTFEGMGRTSEETSHQRDVSSGVADGSNQHGAVTGDHAGHVVAHRFMLDQGLHNLFPQNGNFNTSAYKTMENELAALVSAQHPVDGSITLHYPPDGTRPSGVDVAYESPGLDKDRNVRFKNEAGQDFKRVSLK